MKGKEYQNDFRIWRYPSIRLNFKDSNSFLFLYLLFALCVASFLIATTNQRKEPKYKVSLNLFSKYIEFSSIYRIYHKKGCTCLTYSLAHRVSVYCVYKMFYC